MSACRMRGAPNHRKAILKFFTTSTFVLVLSGNNQTKALKWSLQVNMYLYLHQHTNITMVFTNNCRTQCNGTPRSWLVVRRQGKLNQPAPAPSYRSM